jgi:hypothetical protein
MRRAITLVCRFERALNAFPAAPELTNAQKNLIAKLVKLWVQNRESPRPRTDVRRHWETLIEDWANTDSLPLYVRKARGNRGSIIRHEEGRSLVPTDNSPAIWAFVLACTGEKPSLKKIKNMVDGDHIPIAFTLSSEEKKRPGYNCTLSELMKNYPNSAGWKFAHIQDVGLKSRRQLVKLDISRLKNHFKNLMTPSNMFVFPKKYGGLAELPEFIEGMKRGVSR